MRVLSDPPIMRRVFCGSISLGLGLASLSGCGPELPPPQHVLLLVIDTQRADHLGCYGYARPTSPALDALAKEGVLFRHAVSQGSWTSPSMVSMMTACYLGDEPLAIPAEKTTLAEAFRQGGFATGGFVCNGILSPENGFDRGFDVYRSELEPYGSNAPILEWIRASKDRPTFTWVHLNEVHDEDHGYGPFTKDEADKLHRKPGRFRRETGAIGPDRLRFYDQTTAELALVEQDASLRHIQAETGGYDDDVAYSDDRIREILDEYKKLGLWDRTAIVVAADHGEGLWTHVQYPMGTREAAMKAGEPPTLVNSLLMTHGSQVDFELLHVPLILKAPGLRPRSVGAWVENVDVGPTLLELARLELPKTAEGSSLLALARKPSREDGLEEAVFSFTRFHSSLITQAGVQVIHPTARGECDFDLEDQVYDLVKDPEARTNLAASRRDLVQELLPLAQRRIRDGIKASGAPISAGNQKALAGLGYIDGGLVDTVREELVGKTSDELIEELPKSTNCLVRLQILRVLRDRTLSAEQKARLGAAAAKEGSRAVREEIERLLSR